MALLHYQNLGVHRPDILMKQSVRGLKIFYDFLTQAKKYMESEDAVMRLAWRKGNPLLDIEHKKKGKESWVHLTEPEDRPNEPDATFRSFLDENVREIYEGKPTDERRDSAPRPHHRIVFKPEHKIQILDRHPETQQLFLERAPAENAELLLRPDTYTIERQRIALRTLQNAPTQDHLPLLRLFESLNHADWDDVSPENIGDWTVLTDLDRPGTKEQRRFVETALSTPDFAFLEGPPGSGKTTAICELILQLARRGKRVLLCASTHVAVDNVLERLMDDDDSHRNLVIPIRIGDRRNVSDKARRWQIEEFVKTERERILRELHGAKPLTGSRAALHEFLRQGDETIERMVLDAANLVCGTTIGILQHPDIRKRNKERRGAAPEFDALIVDEASKTTFQEFLVPALWAKRWIIMGDPKQLSPYVDDEALAANIETCLPEKYRRDACVDAFMAAHGSRRSRVAVVVADSEETKCAYKSECAASERPVEIVDSDEAEGELWAASIVIGGKDSLQRKSGELPLDVATLRCADGELPLLRRRADAWLRLSGQDREEQPEWAGEVGWRLARLYEQRFTDETGRTRAARLKEEIDNLLPAENNEKVWENIDRVRRVALPSVLESLQSGFERDGRQRWGTALSDGLPDHVFERRHVLLSTQHRMHPEIAKFSHRHIYDEEALRTPDYMDGERRWSYSRYGRRAVWIDVRAAGAFRNNRNEKEADQVIEELGHFDKWAKTNRRGDGSPWQVAVLTFYRGQEREIRDHLRRWTGSFSGMRHFRRGSKDRPHMAIELCTVDRFQGHEADFVLISFANRRPTSFLESPNRLNVALTRARYQRVVIGNRDAMRRRAGDGALREFAEHEVWDLSMGKAGR